jgi:hypothetical protein
MPNPFDDVIDAIRTAGYHNHRLEEHSDLVSEGIFRDLLKRCVKIADDYKTNAIGQWFNVPAPGRVRGRRIDLFVGETSDDGLPHHEKVRIVVENKSVITAHRNKTNRIDDLEEVLGAVHHTKAEAVTVATVMVGTATRVLNIPDHVKKRFADEPLRFEAEVLPRLSLGDQSLWKEFGFAASLNKSDDPRKTIELFRRLPTRPAGQTHITGYDFVLIVPVYIDNVDPPYLCRYNTFGIDVDADYERMLTVICRAYEARWHF